MRFILGLMTFFLLLLPLASMGGDLLKSPQDVSDAAENYYRGFLLGRPQKEAPTSILHWNGEVNGKGEKIAIDPAASSAKYLWIAKNPSLLAKTHSPNSIAEVFESIGDHVETIGLSNDVVREIIKTSILFHSEKYKARISEKAEPWIKYNKQRRSEGIPAEDGEFKELATLIGDYARDFTPALVLYAQFGLQKNSAEVDNEIRNMLFQLLPSSLDCAQPFLGSVENELTSLYKAKKFEQSTVAMLFEIASKSHRAVVETTNFLTKYREFNSENRDFTDMMGYLLGNLDSMLDNNYTLLIVRDFSEVLNPESFIRALLDVDVKKTASEYSQKADHVENIRLNLLSEVVAELTHPTGKMFKPMSKSVRSFELGMIAQSLRLHYDNKERKEEYRVLQLQADEGVYNLVQEDANVRKTVMHHPSGRPESDAYERHIRLGKAISEIPNYRTNLQQCGEALSAMGISDKTTRMRILSQFYPRISN